MINCSVKSGIWTGQLALVDDEAGNSSGHNNSSKNDSAALQERKMGPFTR